MLSMINFSMFTMSLLFSLMKHPLTLGLILIIQTLNITLYSGIISQTFWFSYILFLVLIGGMLILFIYVISFIFNKIFNQIFNFYHLLILSFSIMILTMNPYLIINNMESMNEFNPTLLEPSMNLMKLYNFPMNLINLLMINYLFFLLIVVVKITNFMQGPLRMKI